MATLNNVWWLNECHKCGSIKNQIETEKGNEDILFEGDKVLCTDCGNKGSIWADGENAWVTWDDEE